MATTGSNFTAPTPEAAHRAVGIVVGLATHNDARTAAAVAQAVQAGLARYFSGRDARLVVADAGSRDGTRDAIRAAGGVAPIIELESPVASLAEPPFHGHPGRAAAVRTILETAQRLGAAVCAFVDPRLETASPEMVERLVAPVLTDGVDYVSPYHVRRASEGAITRGIVYPMFRALYGVRLRQPAAGEFGCSARLADHLIAQDFWSRDRAAAGIDLWLASEAVGAGFRICEAAFGERRTPPLEQPVDLSTTLAQIVGALFADLERRVDLWQRTRRSAPVPLVGSAGEWSGEAPPLAVDSLVESFRLGYRELREIWTWVLPPRTIVELRKLTAMPPGRLRFEDRFWAGIIYDFAAGYGFRVMAPDHLLRSLTPLYAGWLASFINEVGDGPLAALEERVERVCQAFEAEKRYLIARWRWPERLR